MLGWLARKGQNSRVYMCIKEVKWELEGHSAIQRATVLALAQLLRIRTLAEMGVPEEVFDRPLDYSRENLMGFYEVLEDIRNHNTQQVELTKRSMRQMGMEMPQFAIDHVNVTKRALETWMCTLGAGIATERRDEVRAIWSYLAGSIGHVGQAILELRQVEERTGMLTGVPSDDMFAEVDTDEWLELCKFVPSIFVKELKLS